MLRSDRNGAAGTAYAGVNHRDVNGVFWEEPAACRQRKGASSYIAGGNFMREVHDRRAGLAAEEDTFHRSHEPILCSEIGSQCDEMHERRLYRHAPVWNGGVVWDSIELTRTTCFHRGGYNGVMCCVHVRPCVRAGPPPTWQAVNNLSTTCTVRRLFCTASLIECFQLDPLSIWNVGKMQKCDKP